MAGPWIACDQSLSEIRQCVTLSQPCPVPAGLNGPGIFALLGRDSWRIAQSRL